MNVGIPAKLVLLQDLPSQASGAKVRFLGCVRSYCVPTAAVTLGHPVQTSTTAIVDVSVPLPTLDTGSLKDGVWINVIGFVTEVEQGSVKIDATQVWSAGTVSASVYVNALRRRSAADEELERAIRKYDEN